MISRNSKDSREGSDSIVGSAQLPQVAKGCNKLHKVATSCQYVPLSSDSTESWEHSKL